MLVQERLMKEEEAMELEISLKYPLQLETE